MAFDKNTRNDLQSFVSEARSLLTDEFTRQLQQDYGLDPTTGEVSDLSKLSHLDDSRMETARVLREILAHYLASEMASSGKKDQQSVLDRIVREQAFTVLNRLAALRMMEARGLLLESVGNGYQSKGFQLYERLAGHALGETGDAYRCYLFSLFDEFALDLKVLFDRNAPQGLLFPRESTLLELLDLFNAIGMEVLWGEDETIGWIYQYFNSQEERKKMRDEGKSGPRNSRELAVRNQFFTPRYVVEFLVDNSLGRQWFNLTGAQTSLADRCQYLLIKPEERTTAVTPMSLRDPRSIKLLDPACGSMHFGLYAFDLFEVIYREAWEWEQQHGPGSLTSEDELEPLSATYGDEDEFLLDVPRLIIERNIFGVDIDPRATQIASLALWLRAQRSWHDAGVKANERPLIRRGNVVAAVAPPMEPELREQLASQLDELDAELFERSLVMLKGLPELGVLLRIEKELPHLIQNIYGERGPMFKVQDVEQWQGAEARLRDVLTQFIHEARSTFQGRLFAQDALEGLRLIDLARERFDVVVMNPPFGEPSVGSLNYIKKEYPNAFIDILSTFVERASELCPTGYIGALTSRACLYTKTLRVWRDRSFLPSVELVVDLGGGVLDGAMVFACASVLKQPCSSNNSTCTFDLRRSGNRRADLLELIDHERKNHSHSSIYWNDRKKFTELNNSRYVYNIPEVFWKWSKTKRTLSSLGGSARAGSTTYDDFRFLRLVWEVLPQAIGSKRTWVFFSKGGYFETYYNDIHLLINWKDQGCEVGEFNRIGYGTDAQSKRASAFYWLPAITYPRRNVKGFSPRVLPKDCIFADKGPAVFSPKETDILAGLGYLNSEPVRALISLQVQAGSFETGIINTVPWLNSNHIANRLSSLAKDVWKKKLEVYQYSEVDRWFVPPVIVGYSSVDEIWQTFHTRIKENSYVIRKLCQEISSHVQNEFGLPEIDYESLDIDVSDHDIQKSLGGVDKSAGRHYFYQIFAGVAFGRWDLQLIAGEREVPTEPEPFDPLPAKSPGMLPDEVEPFHQHAGILVDDLGHHHDIVHLIESVFEQVNIPVPSDVSRWLQRDFFKEHLKQYSKSRRKAPIYWPLATASGSYTLWIYYPALNAQTLYTAVNDFIEPKLKSMVQTTEALRTKTDRSKVEERELEKLQNFELELTDLRDTLLQIAKDYAPNLDDGVQISAAPLWPLFRHKPWQNILKSTWAKLEKGDYDWAHLAMNYWPDRVHDKCKMDKSLAIAHGLEELYEEPPEQPKKKRGRRKA